MMSLVFRKSAWICLLLSLSSNAYSRSSEMRANHNFSATVGVGYQYDKVASRIDLSYFLKPSLILGLNLINLETSTTDHDNDISEDITYDSGNGFASELSLKSFQNNSFYVSAGVYYRNQSITEMDIDDGGFFQFGSDVDASGVVQDTGLLVAIGNQWQWSHFTLGCDWAGYSASLKQWKYENNGEGQAVFLNNLRLLHFYLGASF